MSKYSPKCFWQWIWWTGKFSKTRSGCVNLTCFFENINWACALRSGLNGIYLCVHVDICRPLFKTSAEVSLSYTTENREVSSGKSLTVDLIDLDGNKLAQMSRLAVQKLLDL